MSFNNQNAALILGMFETGLGVGRSLGKEGIKVYGLDFKKDIGFYSTYINANLCPHPISDEEALLEDLIVFSKSQTHKPALFVTSDDFLNFVAKFSDELKPYYLFNLPSPELINQISDKYKQFLLASNTGISLPATYKISSASDLDKVLNELVFPVFIKALDVNIWRKLIGGTTKGFVVNDPSELKEKITLLLNKGLEIILQEIIPGPDTQHFKYCTYIGVDGRILLEFTLRKIRQNPIRFGVGAVVESIDYPELVNEGRKLVVNINYRGVGSAEFKLDSRDGKLKLIELNPRYWQQNSLATACGMNFPLMDYLEVTGQYPAPATDFKKNIKWVNRYMDFGSFIQYRKEGELTFREWRRSLSGKKVYPDFTWNDPVPALYEIGFGLKLFKVPWFLYKKFLRKNHDAN
jgi:predicted ATP-grasp superfamily ATP-dependent carboligase